MSVAVDTNVLLYASDTSSRFHPQARALLDELARGPEIVYMFWPVVLGYLRVSTHPGIFANPLAFAAASANVTNLLAMPHIRAGGERDGFWAAFRDIAEPAQIRGDLVPDAQLAALVRQHEVDTLLTHDRDFRRFDGIRVRDPFAA